MKKTNKAQNKTRPQQHPISGVEKLRQEARKALRHLERELGVDHLTPETFLSAYKAYCARKRGSA